MKDMPTLRREDLPDNPFALVSAWLETAVLESGLDNPNAVFLSTVGEDGVPEGRIVLLKEVDHDSFMFFTNRTSRKGQDLDAHPVACLTCFWDVLGRQLRVVGGVERVADAESDTYFASRARGSQIGAWASEQSQPLAKRAELEARVARYDAEFSGQEVPRPPHWGGYRIKPSRVEFWQSGEARLHDRFEYQRGEDGTWTVVRLNP